MKNIDQSQDNTNHGFIQCLVLEMVMAVLKSVEKGKWIGCKHLGK